MDPTSDGCRLCLDTFAECFTTIENPQLKNQMAKIFCFSIEPKQGYCSGVCQSCSYTISEFYQYSEKVRQNQEVLNGNVPNCDPTVDSKITFEPVKVVKVETLSDCGLPGTSEDTCELEDEVSGEEEVLSSGDDKSYKSPPKMSQPERKGRPEKRKLDHYSKHTIRKTLQELNKEDQLFNKHIKMICDLCGTSAATFTALCCHFKKEHEQRDIYVVCCNMKLSHRKAIREHVDFHVNPDVFRCEKCNNSFKCKKYLIRHMAGQHSGKNRTMVCDICGKKFRTKRYFNRHMFEHRGMDVQQFQCEICDRWLKTKYSLRNHMMWMHTDGNLELECDICLQKYPNSHALYNHKNRTHAEPKHECEFCGSKFKRASALKEHRTTHTGEEVQQFQQRRSKTEN